MSFAGRENRDSTERIASDERQWRSEEQWGRNGQIWGKRRDRASERRCWESGNTEINSSRKEQRERRGGGDELCPCWVKVNIQEGDCKEHEGRAGEDSATGTAMEKMTN